jgi:ABC-type branched-subunit amino acid transport system substrate-binding protein
MTSKDVHTRSLLPILVSLVLIATACGAGDGEGQDGAEGGGVTIGAVVPLTGELAAVGEPTAEQFEWVVEIVNATGLNPCGDIRLVVRDQGDPEEAIRAATQLVRAEGAVAIAGPTSDGSVAIAPFAKTEEVVLFSPPGGTVTLDELGGDFVYRAVPSDSAGGEVAARWLTDQGYQRPAYMILNEESPLSLGEVAIDIVEQAGIPAVAEVIFNPGQPSYQGELGEILDADPDVIFLAGGLESGSTVIREADAAGYTGDWYLTSDMAVQEVVDTVGADVMGENFYGAIPSPDESLPEYAQWREMFDAEIGGEPGPYVTNSFDVMNVLALAMTGPMEGCDGPAINANMREVTSGGTKVSSYEEGASLLLEGEDIDYDGASGPLEFDETGTPPGSFSVLQVQDGVWESVEFYSADTFVE